MNNAMVLALQMAARAVETEIRASGRHKLFLATYELPAVAKRYLAQHPELIAEAEWMIAFHPRFAWLRRSKIKTSAQKRSR